MDDYTDSTFVLGAVLAQIEDLDVDARRAVLAEALRQTSQSTRFPSGARSGNLLSMNENDNELPGEVIDLLAAACFVPTDDDIIDEGDMTATERATISYFAAKGFTAVRLEGDRSLTFVCDAIDEGITLVNTTPSGVINAEARFDFNRRGVAWLSAAVS